MTDEAIWDVTIPGTEISYKLVGRYGDPPDMWDGRTIDEVYNGDVYKLGHDDMQTAIRDQVVLDIGANIGCVSTACLNLGARRVIGVEPEAANIELLKTNVAAWPDRFELIRAAAGSRANGDRAMSIGTSGGSYVVAVDDDEAGVEILTLPELVGWAHRYGIIGLLKVDIEGAEYALFDTCRADTLVGVDRIIIEWHASIAPHLLLEEGAYGKLLETLAWTHAVSVFGRPNTGGMIYAHPYESPERA